MTARLRILCLAVLGVGAAACPAPVEVVELGSVELELWQPEELDTGDAEDLLAVAERRELTVVSSTESVTVDLDEPDGEGAARAEALLSDTEASEVSMTLRLDGDAGLSLARTGIITLTPGSSTVARAALAPVDRVHRLTLAPADARQSVAACTGEDGRAFLIGGTAGGGLAFGSWLLDPALESIVEGPGVPARRQLASCVVLGADVLLVGGCDEAGGEVDATLFRSTDGGAFASVGDLMATVGCGGRMVRAQEGVWIVSSDVVERRDRDGGELANRILSEERFFARVVADADGVFVSGGFTDAQMTTEVPGGVFVANDGTLTGRPELGGSLKLGHDREGGAVVWLDGEIRRLLATGPGEVLIGSAEIPLPVGRSVSELAPLADGRFALLDDLGENVLIVGGSEPVTAALPEARPGGHLLPEPGGAVRIAGGGRTGLDLLVPGLVP